MHLNISKKVLILLFLAVLVLAVAGALGLFDFRSASTALRVQASNVAGKVGEVAKLPAAGNSKIPIVGDAAKMAAVCRDNLRRIESAKRAVMERSGVTTADVSFDAVKREMGGQFPVCPAGGQYLLGNMQVTARCTIAGNTSTDPADDHILTKF